MGTIIKMTEELNEMWIPSTIVLWERVQHHFKLNVNDNSIPSNQLYRKLPPPGPVKLVWKVHPCKDECTHAKLIRNTFHMVDENRDFVEIVAQELRQTSHGVDQLNLTVEEMKGYIQRLANNTQRIHESHTSLQEADLKEANKPLALEAKVDHMAQLVSNQTAELRRMRSMHTSVIMYVTFMSTTRTLVGNRQPTYIRMGVDTFVTGFYFWWAQIDRESMAWTSAAVAGSWMATSVFQACMPGGQYANSLPGWIIQAWAGEDPQTEGIRNTISSTLQALLPEALKNALGTMGYTPTGPADAVRGKRK